MVKFNSTSERLKLLEDIEEHNTFFFHICNFYVDSWIVKTLLKVKYNFMPSRKRENFVYCVIRA